MSHLRRCCRDCGRKLAHRGRERRGRPRLRCETCSEAERNKPASRRIVPDLTPAAIDALLTRAKLLRKWGVTDERGTA